MKSLTAPPPEESPPPYRAAGRRAPTARGERRERWERRGVRVLGFLFLCVVGAGFLVSCFGMWTYRWRAFEVQVGVQPAWHGQTRLRFAPLGEVRARTHRTPVALTADLRGISFDALKTLVLKPPPRPALEREFQRVVRRSLLDMALRQTLLGAAGALLVPLVFRVRRLRWWLAAAASGGGFVALTFGLTLWTFNPRAFHNPTYTGSLQQARWIIALVEDAASNSKALGKKLQNVAGNLSVLYGRISAMPDLPADEDTIRVLHISDIHNNPAAVGFVRELAQKIQVDLVVDTGDLTDFGTPLESQLGRGMSVPGVPYVFVAGNHDSRATVRAVAANPDAVILEGEPVTVAGLTLIGGPDPASLRPGPGDVNTPPDALQAASERLAEHYQTARPVPDLVCVHNPRQAEGLVGTARVILCGHMHRAYVETEQDSVICNAGTTGAAGARYFDKPGGVPFSAAILAFARGPRPRLLYIDQVVLDGALNEYSIRRRTFAASSGENPPALP